MRLRTTLAAVGFAAGALGVTLGAAAPAQAASAYGCNWPWVCFYPSYSAVVAEAPTASYRDVTSDWQWLGSRSKNAYMVYNSRNDDGARLLYENNSTYCLPPNSLRSHDRSYSSERVVAIRIMDSPSC